MTELKRILDELADEAKAYDVVDRAQKRARARRWLTPAAACAAVVVAAAGTATAIGLYDRPAPAGQLTEGTGTTTAAAPATLPAAPPAPTSCAAAQLPVPAGYPPKAIVSGGDPSGRYIIGRGYPGIYNSDAPSYGALLWDNGEVTPLDIPGAEVVPVDVNSSGEVIINSWLDDGGTAGFSYYEGVVTRLAGENAQLAAINDDGAIVGFVSTFDQTAGTVASRPVVWRSATAEPEPIGPAELTGEAVGIDDDGTIIVHTVGGVARVEPGGAFTIVPPPAGVPAEQVRGYRDGWIVSNADAGTGPYFVWNMLVGEAHELPALTDAVNAHGWVVINLNPIPAIGEPFSPEGTAFLLTTDGTRVDVPPLTGEYSNYALLTAYISDDGRTVAGQAVDPTYSSLDADDVAVVWHCG